MATARSFAVIVTHFTGNLQDGEDCHIHGEKEDICATTAYSLGISVEATSEAPAPLA
jgi:hypothetical protein